jgi:hypothetical protein
VVVVSASLDRALAPVVSACGELGVAVEALEQAEEAGVLTLRDDQVTFTHPLLRGVAAVRLLSAALAAGLGGDYERSAALLESIATVEQPALRAAVRHLLVLVTLSGGIRDPLFIHASLTEEAERIAAGDAGVAAEMHADAAVTARVAGPSLRRLSSSCTARAWRTR